MISPQQINTETSVWMPTSPSRPILLYFRISVRRMLCSLKN